MGGGSVDECMEEKAPHFYLDEQLLIAAKRGNGEEKERVMKECWGYLLAMARAEWGQELQAKVAPSDLVQESCMEIERDLKNFRGSTATEFLGWIRQILARNMADAARKFKQSEKRDVSRERRFSGNSSTYRLKQLLCDKKPGPEDEVIRKEEEVALQQALGKLPEELRNVVKWRYQEQKSFGEIAILLNTTEKNAHKLWSKAVLALSRMLRQDLPAKNYPDGE